MKLLIFREIRCDLSVPSLSEECVISIVLKEVGTMRKLFRRIKYLPRMLFNLLLSVSASSYVIVVFLIKEKITLPFLPQRLGYISYIFYLIVPLSVAKLCLRMARSLSACNIQGSITEVELASHSFLPNYLGYFFVALSIPDLQTLIYVYGVIFIFTHVSRALSFNPMFLIFGYQFYFVTSDDGTKIFLITKQNMKAYQDAYFDKLRKINEFTFIDLR